MDMESVIGQMEVNIKENGRIIKEADMESMCMLTDKFIMATSKIMKEMGKDFMSGLMAKGIKDSG